MTITAIETHYADCRFRSRLEARWAVFFDHLGIRWEYEPQGYVVGNPGRPYLPDFWLPDFDMWAEVKPADHDAHSGEWVRLCRSLADEGGKPVLLLAGLPEARIYNSVAPNLPGNSFQGILFRDWDPKLVVADQYWFHHATFDEGDGSLRFDGDERQLRKSFGSGLAAAIRASKSARFEHGERG